MCFQFPKKFGCLFHIATRIISSEIETQHDQRRDEANSRTTSNWWSGTATTRNNEKWSSRRGESLYIQLRHTSAFTCEIEHWVNEKKDWISSHRYPKTWYTTEEIQLFFSSSSLYAQCIWCLHAPYRRHFDRAACMQPDDDISRQRRRILVYFREDKKFARFKCVFNRKSLLVSRVALRVSQPLNNKEIFRIIIDIACMSYAAREKRQSRRMLTCRTSSSEETRDEIMRKIITFSISGSCSE